MLAREQIDAGNYEAACALLTRWWQPGEWPKLTGLTQPSYADLLLTVGSLAGYFGSTHQMPKGQRHAEELLNGAIALFEQLMAKKQCAEGRIELALCYKREGLLDLARSTLLTALDHLSDHHDDLRGLALVRLSSLEREAGRFHEAAARLTEAGAIVNSLGPWATGRYYLELASTYKELAIFEGRSDYFDQAFEFFGEALFEFEAVGNHRLAAIVEINHGYLLLNLDRLAEAELSLTRARKLFASFGDRVRGAQTDDCFAQLYLARRQFELAEEVINRSIQVLAIGGEARLLAESLRTQGLVFSKLGRYREAERILDLAQQVSEQCGDPNGFRLAIQIKSELQFCRHPQEPRR